MDKYKYLEEINALNGKPYETFQRFGLPITIIDDVGLIKSGKSRKFIYAGKELFSPEVVSVVYFEQMGLKACWSEGVAVDLIRSAIAKYVFNGYQKHVRYVGIKPDKLQEAVDQLAKYNESMRDAPAWGSLDDENRPSINPNIRRPAPEPITVMSITSLGIRDSSEKRMLEEGEGVYPFEFSYNGDIQAVEKIFHNHASIEIDCPVAEIHALACRRIEEISQNSSILFDLLTLPKIEESETYQFSAKFIKPYVLDFAEAAISHIPSNSLLDFVSNLHGKNWDLLVLGKEPGQYRIVEVKLEDDLTTHQRFMLADALSQGEIVELCIVRPKLSNQS